MWTVRGSNTWQPINKSLFLYGIRGVPLPFLHPMHVLATIYTVFMDMAGEPHGPYICNTEISNNVFPLYLSLNIYLCIYVRGSTGYTKKTQ